MADVVQVGGGVAAVVPAFMVTPPLPVLDNKPRPLLTYTSCDLTVKQFLKSGSIADSSHIFGHDLYIDSAKLQSIPYGYQGVHKLTVVGVRNAYLVHGQECQALFHTRHMIIAAACLSALSIGPRYSGCIQIVSNGL